MSKSEILIKYIKIIITIIIVIFVIYKIFDWKVIFDREYEVYTNTRLEPVLPPIIIYSSSTERLSFDQRVYIEKVIRALATREIIITQVEESEVITDVKLLTSEDYRIIISTAMDGETLINNIFNVYESEDFQKDKKTKLSYENLKQEVEAIRSSTTSLTASSSATSTADTDDASSTASAINSTVDSSKNNKRLQYVDFRFGDKVYYR